MAGILPGWIRRNLKHCFQSLGQRTGEPLVTVFGSRNKNWLTAFKKELVQGLLRGDSPPKNHGCHSEEVQSFPVPGRTTCKYGNKLFQRPCRKKRPIRNWALRMWRFWKRWIPSPVHFVQVWIEKWFPCRSFNRVLPFPRSIPTVEELRPQ